MLLRNALGLRNSIGPVLFMLIYINSGTLYVCFLVKKKFHSAASLKMILMKSQGFNIIKNSSVRSLVQKSIL